MSDLYANSAKTLNEQQIQALVDEFEALILDKSNRRRMLLTTEWKNGFPIAAGVYPVFDNNEIVYAGETGSIRGRMNDLRHT